MLCRHTEPYRDIQTWFYYMLSVISSPCLKKNISPESNAKTRLTNTLPITTEAQPEHNAPTSPTGHLTMIQGMEKENKPRLMALIGLPATRSCGGETSPGFGGRKHATFFLRKVWLKRFSRRDQDLQGISFCLNEINEAYSALLMK